MAQSNIPRRPAMLDSARAESIVGDEDPAEVAAVAHTAAWALMGVGDDSFTDEDVARLREAVRARGVDAIAHVWSRSPEFTLPGALWRLYLLHEWYHRDPGPVESRYSQGASAPTVQRLEDPTHVRPLSLVMEEVDSLLHGGLTDDDLEHVLAQASRAMRVLAAGEAGALWIEDPADPLAHRVTTRTSALAITADELGVAAREAAAGTLD